MKKRKILFIFLVFTFLISLHPSSAFSGSATLSWDPPSINADGTPLTDLAGYKIYYGTSSGNYSQSIDVGNVTTYSVNNLTDGLTYYFATNAYDTARNESQHSNEITKKILDQRTLNVSNNGTGKGTVSSSPADISCCCDCTETYSDTVVVTLVASPDTNSFFAGWSGACSGTGTCTLTMNSSKTVMATFNLKTYTITASTQTGGNISPSGSVSVNHGASKTFIISASTGNHLVNVNVDGNSIWATNSYTFSNITANHAIEATFAPNKTPIADFSDDFSSDTTGEYTVTHTWTQGGVGSFFYDSVGQRAKVRTGDNVALQLSHDLPPLDTGTFTIDFLPTKKYPVGGMIEVRLVENQNTYYEISNANGYAPGGVKKIINGQVVDSVSFQNGYRQNNNYRIEINFSPDQTTVNAFGETIAINTDGSNIMVGKFNVEVSQQDAYFDNIEYRSSSGNHLPLDDFSSDTTGEYTVTHTLTQGGVGSFFYDSVGQRAKVRTGDNVALQLSHDLPPLDTGTFTIDFLPTKKYPSGGWLHIRLVQDASNYYDIQNTDGYGAKRVRKIVNGTEMDSASFTSQYSQNNNYHIMINFSPNQTTVNAFGNILTMNSNNSSIMVNRFEIELRQQDAYFDNIEYE